MLPRMWKAIGASVIGNTHIADGTGCQDASGWRTHAGVTCLAVADGAGSRSLSATGSALAVEESLHTVAALAADESAPEDLTDWLRAAFGSARDRIAAFASAADRKPGEYATTLAVAILKGDHVAVGQVGDCIVVVGIGGRCLTVDPEIKPRDEYVNGTFFLTASDWHDRLRLTLLAGAPDVVALSTDGLRYKITDTATGVPFEPFFDDILGYAQRPAARSAGVGRALTELENDQSGDDKSLMVAVRVGAPPGVAWNGGEIWCYGTGGPVAVTPDASQVPPAQALSAQAPAVKAPPAETAPPVTAARGGEPKVP